jgi:anti-sigma factor RsiW
MSDERTEETISDTRLHRYFDGDLSPAEEAEVRRAVEADPVLRAKLDGLREVRDLLRESVSEAVLSAEGVEVPSDAMWAKVEAGLAAGSAVEVKAAPAAETREEKEDRPALRAIAGGAATATPARPAGGAPGPAAAKAAPRRRRPTGFAIASIVLAAAATLLFLWPGDPGPQPSDRVAHRDDDDVDPVVEPPPTAEELVFRTEVLEVDFGDNTGAIFAVEDENGDRYAVVWLADEKKNTAVE